MTLVVVLPVVAVVVALTVLYLKWQRVKNYWKKRGVPHSSPHPLLGSLTFIRKQNASVWLRNIYENFKSPYVGIWLFWRPAVVIRSYEIAQRILIKDFDCFRNRLVATGLSEVDPIGGLSIFSLNEPAWSPVRRKLTPVFTSAKLKNLHGLYSKKSRELVKRIEQDTKKKKPMELRSLFADYTTDVIGIASFGVDNDATLTGESPMRKVTKEFMKFPFYRSMGWVSIFFYPELTKFFRFTFFPKQASDYFTKVYKQIVKQRGGYNGRSEVNDLLDALRKMKYDADSNNEDMDENLLIAQAVVFLQGGFDTAAGTLTYATYELAFNPDIQPLHLIPHSGMRAAGHVLASVTNGGGRVSDTGTGEDVYAQRVYEELLEVKQKNGNKDFDESFIKDLPYFNCVQKEALRKYSPLGWLDRVCDRDYRLDENLTIPKGTTVYVNLAGMHYDPAYYPEPEIFKPERFLDIDQSTKPYLPFGDGPRSCIGMRFAHRTIWYALYEMILNFEIRPVAGSTKPADLKSDKIGLLNMPGEPLHVQFTPRH